MSDEARDRLREVVAVRFKDACPAVTEEIRLAVAGHAIDALTGALSEHPEDAAGVGAEIICAGFAQPDGSYEIEYPCARWPKERS